MVRKEGGFTPAGFELDESNRSVISRAWGDLDNAELVAHVQGRLVEVARIQQIWPDQRTGWRARRSNGK